MTQPVDAADPGIPGIDVSHCQGRIDWTKVAHANVRYAFVKATDGQAFIDPSFERNWRGATDAGLLVSAYHFFRPSLPVNAQAALFLRALDRIGKKRLPPVLDLEASSEWSAIAQEGRVALALQWLEYVESRDGRTPIVYLCPSFATDVFGTAAPLARFLLWTAEYSSAPRIPQPWTTWTLWQHSDKGQIDGISGFVDVNWFRGSIEDLQSLAAPTKAKST